MTSHQFQIKWDKKMLRSPAPSLKTHRSSSLMTRAPTMNRSSLLKSLRPSKKRLKKTTNQSSHPPSINQIWINKFRKNTIKMVSHQFQIKQNWKMLRPPTPSLSTHRLCSLMSRVSTMSKSSTSSNCPRCKLKFITLIFHINICLERAEEHCNQS